MHPFHVTLEHVCPAEDQVAQGTLGLSRVDFPVVHQASLIGKDLPANVTLIPLLGLRGPG